MIIDEDEYLAHYGTLHKSGRYPWGSGGNAVTRNKTLIDYIKEFTSKGFTEAQIAEGLGVSTTQLRAEKSIEINEQRQSRILQIQRLAEKGNSVNAISERLGIPARTVYSLLEPGRKEKADHLQVIADIIKQRVDEAGLIDIGSGVENMLGISETKLKTAVAILQTMGYRVHLIPIRQLGTGETTKHKVIAPPGTEWGEAMKNRLNIQQLQRFSNDGARTTFGILPPKSISKDRIDIRYGPDGGAQMDGVIFVRPGVENVSIGGSRYAQVRILVGKSHYIKGMAMYRDDLPPSVDLVFNTNKKSTGNKLDALKPVTGDADNPFGSWIKRQIIVKDSKGNDKVTSVMNIVHEEGNWSDWSRTISSQMLSKQSPKLIKQQLDMTYEGRVAEFNRISKLTNPTVRRLLLEKFAESTDNAAVQLDAARLPRQAWHAILPISSMPPGQVYAPGYDNGQRVVLVRFPHSGTFEIPELIVNNRHPEAVKLLGGARDAVGIHHSVAERLSGADFDGDAVLVIANDSNKVTTSPALEGLKGFDPRSAYPGYPGMKKMTNTQLEMGKISNLITDMTLRGASTEHLARAVRHSMVVIDAEKHGLNYKESEKVNGIKALKEQYQIQPTGHAGASTLISRATAEIRVDDRKPRSAAKGGPIDKDTGKKVYEPTGKKNYLTGQPKQIKSQQLAETDDAHTLSSGTIRENLYAEHSNRLKTLANRARKDSANTPPAKYSDAAAKTYAKEVASLNSKLFLAVSNRPLERQAQVFGNAMLQAKRNDNPNMDTATLNKVKSQILIEARRRTGASKQDIKFTQEEWNAIQAGAISDSRLSAMLAKADLDVVRQLATPRVEVKMSSSMTSRAQSMLNSGFTRSEVAAQLGVSLSTLDSVTSVED